MAKGRLQKFLYYPFNFQACHKSQYCPGPSVTGPRWKRFHFWPWMCSLGNTGMTRSRLMGTYLPHPVPKYLTTHRMSKIEFQPDFRNPQMLSFLNMYNTMGKKWTVWPWESIFSQKLPKKQRFRRQDFRITWLRRGLAPTILKIETFPACVSENLGHKLSD